MKKITTLLLALMLPLFLVAQTPATEGLEPLSSPVAADATDDAEEEGLFWWEAGANIASNYLWRGFDQSYRGDMFDPSIQPSVTLGLGAFYLDLWLNVSPISEYQEFDMTLGFDWKNLSITVYDVWCGVGKSFWQTNFFDGSMHSLTATVDYTFFDRLRLHWGTTFLHSADWLLNDDGSRKRRAFSSYFEIAYTQPVKSLFDVTVVVGASPWTAPFYTAGPQKVVDGIHTLDFDNQPEGFNVTNINLTISREFSVKDVTFPVEVGYTYNPTTERHYTLIKAGFRF